LKAGPIRFNVSKRGTPKPGFHRPKDRQRSKVLEGINTGNNGFKDPNSWESTERGPYIPEDRPYEPVESQEVIIGPKQASIGRLDLKTSRRTARERPYIPVEPRDVKKTDDMCKNPKDYNVLLQLASL